MSKIKKSKDFEVEAGRWNLKFNHSDNEGMTQIGPIQAYYLDSQFGEGDIGINYGVLEDGSVYHADFMCYGDSPDHYALRDGESIGLNFDSEEDMIDAFKKWLKSLEIPMDKDGYITESAKKSFNDMVKDQRNKNIKKAEYYSDFSESDIEDMSLMFQYIEDMAKDCKKRGRGENMIIRLSSEKSPDVFFDEVREVYEKMQKINADYVEYWHN